MNQWQQSFSKRVGVLRETAVQKFEHFADDVLVGVYEEYAEFTSRHEFRSSAPQQQHGTRFYKFALSEDAYVLIFFRARGIDAVEWYYECSAPGHGCTQGQKATVPVAEASRQWVERCFQASLDELVTHVSKTCVPQAPELVKA